MTKRRRMRWDRVFLVFGPLLLLILILAFSCHHDDSSDTVLVSGIGSSVPVDSSLMTETQPDNVPIDISKHQVVICLDAGHGGYDGGAIDSTGKRNEKDDNLNLACAVEKAFHTRYPDVQIVMTRTTDEFVELQERCDIANNANADFFISLHRNSSKSGNGVEIWINNDSGGDNSSDKLLAEYIMDWLDGVGISERRGIQTGFRNSDANNESNNYYVNRYTNMPSCLIEMGFMTSQEDNRNFDDHLEEYADAIVSAVMELTTDKGMYPARALQ